MKGVNIDRGVYVNYKPLRKFDILLQEWINNILIYCRFWRKKDAPYWYNERATLSTFAGAVWKAGGFALEEYRSTKRRGEKRTKGRIEIYFRWLGKDYAGEAKQLWFRLTKRKGKYLFGRRIQERMESAIRGAKAIPRSEGTRLGLVFIVPSINRSIFRPNYIHDIVDELHEQKYDLCAWCFPKCARKLRDKKNIYPGTALVIDRWKKRQ